MGTSEPKGFPLVAWDEVCRPKFEGGLGIRKNGDVNKVTIAKLDRRILICELGNDHEEKFFED